MSSRRFSARARRSSTAISSGIPRTGARSGSSRSTAQIGRWSKTTLGSPRAWRPHPRYAEACRQGEWSRREPTAIPVHAFVDELIPQLLADELQIAVFPLPDGLYTPVAPRQLRSDLEAELVRIE
jgi:hypothetical protein